MKNVRVIIAGMIFMSALAFWHSEDVYAIQPSTQAELDKANANLLQKEEEMKKAFDYWDECKAKLEQITATGDVNAIYYADLECKRAANLVDWNASNYFIALGYVDKVKKNIIVEERKEKYTNYILKRAEVDLVAGTYQQAQSDLKYAQDFLNQINQSIADMNVALPTHPELASAIAEKTALLPGLQAEVAAKEAAVNAAKVAFEEKQKELEAFRTVYWTYGEHSVFTEYREPFYPIEKVW